MTATRSPTLKIPEPQMFHDLVASNGERSRNWPPVSTDNFQVLSRMADFISFSLKYLS